MLDTSRPHELFEHGDAVAPLLSYDFRQILSQIWQNPSQIDHGVPLLAQQIDLAAVGREGDLVHVDADAVNLRRDVFQLLGAARIELKHPR